MEGYKMFQFFKVSNAGTHRAKDENGYISVDKSPILCAGVLEYYGSELISGDAGEIDGRKIDPDKVYKVFVPEEEMKKGAQTFRLLPIVNGHEWLGQDGADARDYQEGTTGEEVTVENGMLYVPLKFTGDGIIHDLESGNKEELSASYTNSLSWASDTDEYDLVASDIKGNHVALVEKGRCGSDVRVLNHKMESKKMKTNNELKLIIDGKEVDLAQFFKQEEQEQEHADTDAIKDAEQTDNADSVDKRALIDEIGGILKGKVDDEVIRTIMAKAEKLAYDASEKSDVDNEDKDVEDEEEDKEKEIPADNKCKSKNEDDDCDKEESIASRVSNAMARREENLRRAYNAAAEICGEFNPFGMSERAILIRALNHAGVSVDKEDTQTLYGMLKVCNSRARVDNGFDYSAGDGTDTVTVNI